MTVPAGCTATVFLPDGTEGIDLGSGTYSFGCDFPTAGADAAAADFLGRIPELALRP